MVPEADRALLRDLARRVAEIAALPEMEARRERWRRHNALQPERPLVLIFPEGAWEELLPWDRLRCETPQARGIEAELRRRIYTYEHFASDNVIDGEWSVGKVVSNSGWGVEPRRVPSPERRGAWTFDPVIRTPADLALLRLPELRYDPEATARNLADAEELFGELLTVRLRGVTHVSFHLMNVYTALRGLEEVMLDMYAEPQMLHDAMAFLTEGYRGLVEQYVALDLLDLNCDNTYHSSGGNGWLHEPPSGKIPERVMPEDMWASAESQEMALVSPEFHREFVMDYERRLLEPFGLAGYGCCEALDHKLDDVCAFANMRRISISPFADVSIAAARLKDRYILSWKPHPSDLVGAFNPDRVRQYLQHAVDVAEGCVLELILKDTHTCEQHPERFDQWTQIAHEVVGA